MKTMVLDLAVPGLGWVRVTATKIGDVVAVEGLDRVSPPSGQHAESIRALILKCATEAFAKMPERVERAAAPVVKAYPPPKNTRKN